MSTSLDFEVRNIIMSNSVSRGRDTSIFISICYFPSKKNDPHDGIKSTGSDPSDEEDVINARQEEVERFNSSIHLENGKRVFSYYWKVSDLVG